LIKLPACKASQAGNSLIDLLSIFLLCETKRQHHVMKNERKEHCITLHMCVHRFPQKSISHAARKRVLLLLSSISLSNFTCGAKKITKRALLMIVELIKNSSQVAVKCLIQVDSEKSSPATLLSTLLFQTSLILHICLPYATHHRQ
jgi:S-adenosylmethionine/arginine decarboxylase-like enzyme